MFGGTATFTNSDFYDNHAFDTAGALYPSLSTVMLRDSHVWANSADFGGGVHIFASTVTLYNSVVHLYANMAGNFVVSGLAITPSDIAVCNNFVAGSNTACGGGSGIYWYGEAAGLDTNGLDAFTIVAPAMETPSISGLEQLVSR